MCLVQQVAVIACWVCWSEAQICILILKMIKKKTSEDKAFSFIKRISFMKQLDMLIANHADHADNYPIWGFLLVKSSPVFIGAPVLSWPCEMTDNGWRFLVHYTHTHIDAHKYRLWKSAVCWVEPIWSGPGKPDAYAQLDTLEDRRGCLRIN